MGQQEERNAMRVGATYIFLQLSPLHRIRMFTDSDAIEFVADSSTRSLRSQTGHGPGRQELHSERDSYTRGSD